jgi:hypothetical protein
MKRLALLVCLLLPLTSLIFAAPAKARAVDQVCAATFTYPLDLNAAAQVKVPNGKRKPRPAGLAAARALAAQVLVDTHSNPCTEPLSEEIQETIDSVQDLVNEGEAALAHDYLLQLATEQTWSAPRTRASLRAAAACDGFTSKGLKLPEEVRTEIGIAQRAQALGYTDVADQAMAKAVSIATEWGNSGAGGEASSIPDWLGIASKLELIGADQAAIDKARASMTKVAKNAYDRYNISSCRATIADVTCFLKAAQFLAMTGSEPATFAKDVAYQVSTARSIRRGNEDPCPVETYLLRITMDSKGGDGQTGHFDTGLMHLKVRDGVITSADRGPLVISSGTGSCWFQDENGAWQRTGTGNLTGGSFPYRVSGTDDGTLLHVRLVQKATVYAHVNGDVGCEAFLQLGVSLMNEFLAQLGTAGLELPAGAADVDEIQTTYGVFEPTGETTVDTSHVIFTMTSPRRTPPPDPYS